MEADPELAEWVMEAREWQDKRDADAQSVGQDAYRPEWKMSDFMGDSLNEVLADALVSYGNLEEEMHLQLAMTQALGTKGEAGFRLVERLLREGDIVAKIARTIFDKAQDLANAAAVSGEELTEKFAAQGGTFTMSYGSISDFSKGLESMVGSPHVRVHEAMIKEHCDSADSQIEWETANYGILTTSQIEWQFAACPDDGPGQLGRTAWPEETKNTKHRSHRYKWEMY